MKGNEGDSIREELDFHLESVVGELVAAGMTREEALEEARRRFGDPKRYWAACREIDRRRLRHRERRRRLSDVGMDLRHALRALSRAPTYAIASVVTLALGIGATTGVFAVLHAVVLRPLPYEDAGRLVVLSELDRDKGRDLRVSAANFVDWRDGGRSFEALAAYATGSANVASEDDRGPERLPAAWVSAELFSVLRTKPARGRGFEPEENVPGSDSVVVLGDGLWRRRFGSDASWIGRSIELDGRAHTVVGVMPAGFSFPAERERHVEPPEIWLPLSFDFDVAASRGAHYLGVVGRLREGTTLEQARSEMDGIARALEEAHPDTNSGEGARVVPLHDDVVAEVAPVLRLLAGGVGLVLLIACLNVGGLTLARASARFREMAVRGAVGASRSCLFWQWLTESAVVASLGGAFGVLVAAAGSRLAVERVPGGIPRGDEVAVDGSILLVALVVSSLSALFFAAVPAFALSRSSLQRALNEGGRSPGLAAKTRWRKSLVIVEVALALVLVIHAGLLLRSFGELLRVPAGFDRQNVLTFRIQMPDARYPEERNRVRFLEGLLDRIEKLPGVLHAGAALHLPMAGEMWGFSYSVAGRSEPEPGKAPLAGFRSVTPDYFHAIGIPLVRGRLFSPRDDESGEPVVLINEALARDQFPDRDPIGQRLAIRYGSSEGAPPEREIVGVVADVRELGVHSRAPTFLYVPFAQVPFSWMSLVARTEGPPLELVPSVRAAVTELDPGMAVDRVRTMEQVFSSSIGSRRFLLTLVSGFALVAVLLAAVGLYGIVAFLVNERRHEFGIRMALGAHRTDVLAIALRQGMALVLAGALIGLALAGLLSRLLESQLFAISRHDPLTFVAVPLALALSAFLACLGPARRAARVDPLVALRHE